MQLNFSIKNSLFEKNSLFFTELMLSSIKNFVQTFSFVSTLGILALSFVVEEVLRHTYNLIYTTTLSGKTFHLFWVKTPLSQGRPALLCSKTA
jgi:tetrahydromethanopterin S-methyltransferase subunit E